MVHWESPRFGNAAYTPEGVYSSSALRNLKKPLDIVLLSANNIEQFKNYIVLLHEVLASKTIIFVDSVVGICLEDMVAETVGDHVVLSMICDVDVRILRTENKLIYKQIGEEMSTFFGYTSLVKNKLVDDAFNGESLAGSKVCSLVELLRKSGVSPVDAIKSGHKPNVRSFYWNLFLTFTSFEILALIYGPLELEKSLQTKIYKGYFNEILKVAFLTCEEDFPNPEDTLSSNKLFKRSLEEFCQKYSSLGIKDAATINTAFEAPFTIHSFEHGFPNYISVKFWQFFRLADQLNVECPHAQCIYSFYELILSLRTDNCFDWITKKCYESPSFSKFQDLLAVPVPISKPSKSSVGEVARIKASLNTVQLPHSNTNENMLQINTSKSLMIDTELLSKLVSQASLKPNDSHRPQNQRIVSGTGLKHPRFSNLPKDLPNGKIIRYKQVKSSIYQKTASTTTAQELERAHKYIYQHGNLNKTFEAVNNRYGYVDSLDVFKSIYKVVPSEIDNAKLLEADGPYTKKSTETSDAFEAYQKQKKKEKQIKVQKGS